MKKIFLSLFALSAMYGYAQKTINIFNYTNYNLSNYLVGSNQANSCYPSVTGYNSIPVPPLGAVSYTGYYNSQTQSPPITSWNVELSSTSGTIVQASTSPLLISLGNTTDWMMNKFHIDDPSGAPLYWSGASIGTLSCGSPIITDLLPSASTPWSFNGAFWFVASGQTYFVIQ